LAEYMGEPQKFTPKDKTFTQLQAYSSSSEGKKLIDHIRDKVNQGPEKKKGFAPK
jgi:hypothetical protein